MKVLPKLVFFSLMILLASIASSAALPVEKLKKVSSFVTAGGEGAAFKRTPQKEFAIGDTVIFLTTVSWEPIDKSAGTHKLIWRWYANGTLVSEIKKSAAFKPTPFELWARIYGSALGAGAHRAEVLIDGKVFDSQEFTISN